MMIVRHNEVVNDDDVVILLGDLSIALRGRENVFSDLLGLMKGRKILIRGNHDKCDDQFYLDAGFIDVKPYMIVDDTLLCHYPCFKTPYTKQIENHMIKLIKKHKCTKVIHGHIHNKSPDKYDDDIDRMNVCVDYTPNNFYPIQLNKQYEDRITKMIENSEQWT